MDLEDFTTACKLPQWGSIRDPRKSEFRDFRDVHITLPAPAFFDYQAKGRYVITREEANEYERRTEAARLQAAAHEAMAAASQYDPSYNLGYPPRHPWA